MTMGPQEAGETEAEPKSKPEEPPGGTAPEGDRKEEKSRERKKERKGSEERERQRRRPSDRGTELGVPDHSPFCCSCEKGGLQQLHHKLALDHATMITRTVTGSGSYRLAICLAPRPGGTIQAQGHQKLCGHVPCEGCAAWVGGNPMCLCCAQRAQDRGSTMQGAGPLPPPAPKAAPKADVVRKEPARAKAKNPASSSYKRRGGEHPEPRRRSPGQERERTPHRENERSPKRIRREQRSPTPREEEEEMDEGIESEEEEYPSEEEDDRSGYWRDDRRPSEPDHPKDQNKGKRNPFPRRAEMCYTRGCWRPARGSDNLCCDQCQATGGRDHSYNCDMRSKGSAPYPPDRSEGPDEDDGKGDGGGKWRKGGMKGKGRNVPKKPRQAQRDRDRDMRRSRAWKGQGKRKTISARAFGRALTLSHAATTIRSTTSRLRTWDTTALQLREQGLLPNVPKSQDPSKLDPNTIKAVVAALRSQNYRSAELYLNTAYLRHKAHHEVSGQLQLAYRMATRMARRGIGPGRGKAPIPIPSPEAWMYPALMVGIWHLLRVNELVSLNIEHVQRKQGPRGYQTALWIEESKTDQQKAGAMVARDCVCDGRAEHLWCPSHILWRQVCKRSGEVRGTGEDPWIAPLFTEDDGHRLTVRTVARAVGQIARKAGEPLERDGVALHGTHSLSNLGVCVRYPGDHNYGSGTMGQRELHAAISPGHTSGESGRSNQSHGGIPEEGRGRTTGQHQCHTDGIGRA